MGRDLPLLLSPAGDWSAARAAVENGADAIYFGLEALNARLRAENFRSQELPELLLFLHRRGVRGYLTVNTLVFPDELEMAEGLVRHAIEAGVDALIVQDPGLCRLVRRLSSDLPLHASTQMTVSDAAGLRYAARLGCSQVTLARELSLAQIAELSATAGPDAPELEVFVHGALCISYSGQCLASHGFSSATEPRSANRGSCAQPCRLPYDLLVDGERPPRAGRYPLSPRDLCALDLIPELVELGVSTLKIEGRLKNAEYVAAATRTYREALDRCAETRAAGDTRELELTFSRGFGPGWYRGRHADVVNPAAGEARGLKVGEVVAVEGRQLSARLSERVAAGDGVLLLAAGADEGRGGRVYSVEQRGQGVLLGFDRALDLHGVQPGDSIWKTSDPALERRLRRSFAGDGVTRFARPVDLVVTGRVGEPLVFEARDELGHAVVVASQVSLVPARRHALDAPVLRVQLGRLGGTPFRLRRLEARLEGSLMLPLSQLNRARREWVEQLLELRGRPPRWTLTDAAPRDGAARTSTAPTRPILAVLVRDPGQVAAAIDAGADALYLELLEAGERRSAIARARDAGVSALLAAPRICTPGEERSLEELRALAPDGYLVRNAAELEAFSGERCVADTSFHAANALTVEHLMSLGMERATAALDLSPMQLARLLAEVPDSALEVVVWLHEPLFHLELCLFCAHLGAGTGPSDCGRPCRGQELRLRDRRGVEHRALVDERCRTTVYHARARDLVLELPRLLAAGARGLRCELLDESPAQARSIVERIRRAIDGLIAAGQRATR